MGPNLLTDLRDTVTALRSDIARGPIVPNVTPEEIRNYLATHYDFAIPRSLDEVVSDTEQMLRTWQVQVTHPRYFGLYNPCVTFAGIVADMLVAMYNPQLATWKTCPGGIEIERYTLSWLSSKFGLPSDSVASFTSGGAEANLSAVTAALTRAFPEFGEQGLQSLRARPTIYLTSEAHHSYEKIAHMTGLGRRAIRMVGTQSDLKMSLADLEDRVAKDRKAGCLPLMVVATAGTTAAGIIDPLAEIAQFCQRETLWFHVDAAWGGAAIVSPGLKRFLAGIEAADSVTCDAHKWLSVPMGAGMFFCRHPEAVAEAFRVATPYMPGKTLGPVSDPYATSVQWSRRFIGLKLFLSLAVNGESGYVEMIEHQTRMGNLLRTLLRRDGWQIANDTPLPVVCFTRDEINISKFVEILLERQTAWMAAVRLSNGQTVVRACITSFQTTEQDIEEVVNAMSKQVREMMVRDLHVNA